MKKQANTAENAGKLKLNKARRTGSLKLILCLAMALCLTVGIAPAGSFAASARGKISFNSPTVTKGDSVTVTMTVSANSGVHLGSLEMYISYDSEMLSYSKVSVSPTKGGISKMTNGMLKLSWYDGSDPGGKVSKLTVKMTFKALHTGTTYVEIHNIDEDYDYDFEDLNLPETAKSKVTIEAPKTASKEAALSSLKVGDGTLTPAFNPDVYSYSLTVPFETEKLVVDADSKDSKASVKVSDTALKVGENTVTVTVTAEDGKTKKTYNLKVTRGEEIKVLVPVSDAPDTLYVLGKMDPSVLPEGFEIESASFKDTDVQSAAGLGLKLLLLGDSEGNNPALYIWDGQNDFERFSVLNVPAARLVVVTPDEKKAEDGSPAKDPAGNTILEPAVPEGWTSSEIEIDGAKLPCWFFGTANDAIATAGDNSAGGTSGNPEAGTAGNPETNAAADFVLLCCLNKAGEKALYLYDTKEQTVQRYTGGSFAANTGESNPGEKSEEPAEPAKNDKSALYIACGVVALCLAELVAIIILASKKNKYKKQAAKATELKFSDLEGEFDEIKIFERSSSKKAAREENSEAGEPAQTPGTSEPEAENAETEISEIAETETAEPEAEKTESEPNPRAYEPAELEITVPAEPSPAEDITELPAEPEASEIPAALSSETPEQ